MRDLILCFGYYKSSYATDPCEKHVSTKKWVKISVLSFKQWPICPRPEHLYSGVKTIYLIPLCHLIQPYITQCDDQETEENNKRLRDLKSSLLTVRSKHKHVGEHIIFCASCESYFFRLRT